MKNALVVLFCISTVAYSQMMNSTQSAQPSVGWDSLRAVIGYPEIARRAGVEGTSNVAVKIDSTGKVMDIMISGYPIFNASIEKAVRAVPWTAQMEGTRRRSSSVFFDVQFKYKSENGMQKKVLVIEANKP